MCTRTRAAPDPAPSTPGHGSILERAAQALAHAVVGRPVRRVPLRGEPGEEPEVEVLRDVLGAEVALVPVVDGEEAGGLRQVVDAHFQRLPGLGEVGDLDVPILLLCAGGACRARCGLD